MRPVVLDLDASVGSLPNELRIPLAAWQESLRFSCSVTRLRSLRCELDLLMPTPEQHGPVLTGSGDFHHLSWPLIERQCAHRPAQRPMRVVVFDNHPDNMRFPIGVHCGSWVRRVAALPGVAHVHVVGITSADIGWAHGWENQLAPLRAGKLTYWSSGINTGWARWFGVGHAFRSFDSLETLLASLCDLLQSKPEPTYLSIDKDVLSEDVVRTNWDQGRLDETKLNRAISTLAGHIVGSDITGDVSAYRYRSFWKRWLSRVDAQDNRIEPVELGIWQAAHCALNQRLVARIASAWGSEARAAMSGRAAA